MSYNFHMDTRNILLGGYTAFRRFLGRDYFSFNCLFNEIKLISSIRRFKIYLCCCFVVGLGCWYCCEKIGRKYKTLKIAIERIDSRYIFISIFITFTFEINKRDFKVQYRKRNESNRMRRDAIYIILLLY